MLNTEADYGADVLGIYRGYEKLRYGFDLTIECQDAFLESRKKIR